MYSLEPPEGIVWLFLKPINSQDVYLFNENSVQNRYWINAHNKWKISGFFFYFSKSWCQQAVLMTVLVHLICRRNILMFSSGLKTANIYSLLPLSAFLNIPLFCPAAFSEIRLVQFVLPSAINIKHNLNNYI